MLTWTSKSTRNSDKLIENEMALIISLYTLKYFGADGPKAQVQPCWKRLKALNTFFSRFSFVFVILQKKLKKMQKNSQNV